MCITYYYLYVDAMFLGWSTFLIQVCFNSIFSYMLLYANRSESPLMCLNQNVLSIQMNNYVIYVQLMICYFCYMIALETSRCLTCDRALPLRYISHWYSWRCVLQYAIISNFIFARIFDMKTRYGVLIHCRPGIIKKLDLI